MSALAGCSQSSGSTPETTRETTQSTTDATTTTTTATTTRTTTTPEYPIENPGLDEVSVDLKAVYEESIPYVSSYLPAPDEKYEDDRQAQVAHLIVEVLNQYDNGTKAMDAAMQALHDELDWFTWENNARLNTETGYAMGTGEGILVNFTDENGNAHFWDFAKGDNQDASIDHNITKNVPDSELMDGDAGIALFADVKAKARGMEKYHDASKETLMNWHIGLQSILWSNDGPVDRQREGKDSHLLFDKDSLEFIDGAYSESAEAARAATDRVNELHAKASQKYDLSSAYLEIGVRGGTLVGSRILDQEQAQDVIYDVSRYKILDSQS